MFKKTLNKIFKKNIKEKNIHPNDNIVSEIRKISDLEIKTIFDVGAHHGRYTESIINNFKNYTIYLFEPFIDSYKILTSKLNNPNCKIYQLAFSDNVGKAKFYLNNLDETNSLIESSKTNSSIDVLTQNISITEVNVSTIDKFCFENSIDRINLLKIDVQGNTLNVLKGAQNLLKAHKIDLIQAEVEFLEIYKNQSLYHHIAQYLEDHGYELYSLYNLNYDVNNRLSWADAIYRIKK